MLAIGEDRYEANVTTISVRRPSSLEIMFMSFPLRSSSPVPCGLVGEGDPTESSVNDSKWDFRGDHTIAIHGQSP
jgi:hypothetical protein